MRCAAAPSNKNVDKEKKKEDLVKQQKLLSQWIKPKANENMEKNENIDSDMDIELASGNIME